jgi:hypothetical protein
VACASIPTSASAAPKVADEAPALR